MRLPFLKDSPFARNVLVLLSGTTLAQGVSVLSLPFLQRIFTPADFGLLNLFLGLSAVLASVSTLKLEYAVVLPRKHEDARVLVSVSSLSVVIFSAVVGGLFFILGDLILPQLSPRERTVIILLMPWMVCFTGLYEVLNYYFNRTGHFKKLAVGRVVLTTGTEGYRFSSYLASFSSQGLIVGRVFGYFAGFIYLFIQYLKTEGERFSLRGARGLINTYKAFPLFTMPTVFTTLVTTYLFVLHFMEHYGKTMTGIVGVANQYIALPLGIIASSFSQVYFKRISEVHSNDQLYSMYKRYAINLFGVSALIAVCTFLVPDSLVVILFGDEWSPLMPYVRLTIIWQGVAFVASSLSFIYTRLMKQRIMFFFGLAQLLLVYGSLSAGNYFYGEPYPTFVIYVLVQAVYYCIAILAALYFIKTAKDLVPGE